MDISTSYYSDFTRISNSNIGWFLQKGPAYLHKMLTEPEEESNSTLERGTMVHEYILQPEEFQKDYVVWNKPKPTSLQQKTFCEELANSLEIEPNKAILSAYKTAYSTKGKKDEQMLSEGLKIASELSDYITFLKSGDHRKMITLSDVKMLEKIKYNIESHKLANKIVWPIGYAMKEGYCTQFRIHAPDDKICKPKDAGYYHEFHINWEFEDEETHLNIMSCKSLLDSVTFDFKTKVCTIVDLKTTGKLYGFEESMKTYDYCRQLMYYTLACKWYLKNELGQNVDEWTFDWYIVCIDVVSSFDIRVFRFTTEQIFSRLDTIVNAIQDIAWHWEHNLWDHSKAYYEGDGSELLNL